MKPWGFRPRFWIGVSAALVVAVALLWRYAWRSPPFYPTSYERVTFSVPIMTMEQFRALPDERPVPHVDHIETRNGALLLFGSKHTLDPQDPQIIELESRWEAFHPTVALVEGRLGFLFPGLMDPIRNYGEMGAANVLARRDGVPVYSWELPREEEVERMLDDFPAERVALFYVLRPYFSRMQIQRPDDPEGFVESFRRERTQYPGLGNTLGSLQEIDDIWRRDFAGLPGWRGTSDAHGYPGYLDEVFARSNMIRDEHLANVILDLVRKGERVFAVAGSSHAVRLEASLRSALGGRG